MHDVAILLLKGVAGGALVAAFAVLSEGLEPKRFAGLFSAAPAVAIASLTLVLLDKGGHDARHSSEGMIAGGVGMGAYAAAAVPLLRRRRASGAAGIALAAWVCVTAAVAAALLVR